MNANDDKTPAPKVDDLAQRIAQSLYDAGHLSLGPAYITDSAAIIRETIAPLLRADDPVIDSRNSCEGE